MREIGLHLRLHNSLQAIVERAKQMDMPIFQFFFTCQSNKSLIEIDTVLKKRFCQWRRDYFTSVFVHGSYFINLASLKYNAVPLLQRELELAKQLSCSHLILHPGSAAGGKNKQEGIDTLVRAINQVTKHEKEITLILENTAHGNKSVGSDISDFRLILEKIDKPERIAFCVDTAHAFSYGYNIVDSQKRDDFISLLERNIGIERIALIHLNDTDQSCGSRIDKHAMLGSGKIGQEALKKFVLDERLKHIPLILELPLLSEVEEDLMLCKVKEWHR